MQDLIERRTELETALASIPTHKIGSLWQTDRLAELERVNRQIQARKGD